tara:strand:- start:106 stop:2697 length:2592 start_codon:yes stop_codon:yes gene_type:complete
MANRKIFPTKDASMYTISQSANTGLDEILEATTVIDQDIPQVSRYLLEFSQDEINTWVTSSVSGSVIGTTAGVMVLQDPYLVRPESYQRFETKGLSYPTSSRNKFDTIVEPLYSGSQNPNEPVYAGGSGTGLQLYLATGASYFKPGVSLSASIATSNAGGQPADNGTIMTAPNGNYGPFAFNRGATGALEADTQGATVTLVVKNNRFEDAFVGTTALTSGAELFGTDLTEGAIPSYGDSNAATMTVLAADLIAAGIQFQGGGLIFNQDILSITGGAAKTAMGGQTGPFLVTLLPSMVSGGVMQTGDSAIVSLTAIANGNLTVATVDTAGDKYVDGNIITIPQATLIAAGFTGAVGTLTITLTASNITEDIGSNDVTFNNGFGQLDDDWGVFPIVTLAANYDPKLSRGKGYKFSDRLYIPSQSFHGSEDYYFELDKVNAGDNSDSFGPVEHKITMDNYGAVVTGLGMDQTLKIYPISGSWNMGTGKYYNVPETTDGVSWIFRNYSGSISELAEKWATSGPIKVASTQQIISTTVGTAVGSLTGKAGVGSRGGTGAQFTITTTGAQFTITTVTCTVAGTGYIPGDTITIAAADLTGGAIGTVTTDLIFKVTTVTGFGDFSVASWSGSAAGGGNWYTGSNVGLDVIQERVFTYGQGIDLDVDVTDTVKTWYTNSLASNTKGFPNNGFLVKQSSSREFVNNKNFEATFRYFSVDTNTIYPPALNLKWNDYNFATGSVNQSVLATQESFVNIYNNAGTYYSESVARMRISAIPKYPDIVFQTASLYTNNHYLPYTSSFYAIKDTDTNMYVVPFSDPYTKISADETSSYFDVYMAGLEPERYYTILIKSTVGGTVKVFDEDIMFKVING